MHTAKRLFFLLVIIAGVQIASAQTKTAAKDSVKTAPVIVNVVNGKKLPRAGEQVIFKAKNSKKIFDGRTDKSGKFSINLPAGDEYIVMMNTFEDSSHYGVLPIAALSGSQFYKTPFSIDITYEPAKVFVLRNVYFDFGKATLQPQSNKQLNELYEYMYWKETAKIEIAGHTDNVGKDEDNMVLSQKRAESVKAWLVKKGIKAERIVAKGYGASKPVADNSTDDGRQQNRRTEVTILE